MEVISSGIACLGGILLDPLKRQWHYIKDLRENMQNLLTEWGELHTQKEDVIQRVDREKSQLRNILNQNEVNLWLGNVNRLEEKVNGRKGEFEEDKRCLYGCLPNYFSRGELAKEIEILIREVGDLKKKKPSVDVAPDQVPPAMLVIPTKSFKGTAAEMAFKKISGWLMDEKIAKIGVYGMGGVGKTTIIKNIKNSLQQENIFSEIIFVTVSRFPVKVIQKDIADQIGFPLNRECSEETSSTMLHGALQQRKRFLLILDDLWSELSLEDVGIPQPNADCKVVLTTRTKVVCQSMRTDKAIKVELLSPEDAWSLFQQNAFANDVVCDAQVKDVAKQVAKECGGLPLAIIKVGQALRGVNDVGEWRNALNQLKASTTDIAGIEEEVFKKLKFSFDRLQNEKLQACFLYCSLFPEDYYIDEDELINHWIWDGLIPHMENKQAEVDNGRSLLNKLKQACMLEFDYDYYSNSVKMHDLMRDMAIGITRHSPRFLVKAGMGLEKAQVENEWPVDVERISLMYNKIKMLSGQPKCSKLRTLMLNDNFSLSENIPHSFFDNMCNLRVLDLSTTNIEMLPDSICDLEKLHVLLLRNCVGLRTLPSDLGKVKELGVLHVSHAPVEEMPESLASLENLLELKLESCFTLKTLPCFAKLKKLRNLNLNYCNSIEELPGSFSELENLHDLYLEGCRKLNVVPSLAMPKELKNINLSRIPIKELPESLFDLKNLEELNLTSCSKLKKVISFANLKKLEKLYLTDTCIEELPESLSDLEKLSELILDSNKKLKKVPSLEKCEQLRILNLASTGIEELPKGMEMLVALKSLNLSHTKSLRRFPHGILPKLSLLQEFSTKGSSCLVGTMEGRIDCKEITGMTRLTRAIFDCDDLPSFFYLFKFLQETELELKAVKSSQPNKTFLLECRWEKKHHYHNITIRELHGSTCLSDFLVCLGLGLMELDDCYINSCDGMMQFGLARLDNNSLLLPRVKNLLESLNRGTMVQQGPLAMLTRITVSACPKLKNLFSLRFLQSLRSLESITVEDCDAMEELIVGDDHGETSTEQNVLPKLQYLRLINLPAFERISSYKSLVSLEAIVINQCPRLKKIPLCNDILQSITSITVEKCYMMELIVGDDDETGVLLKLTSLRLIDLPALERISRKLLVSLEDIEIKRCPHLKKIPFCLQSIYRIIVEDCGAMELIGGDEDETGERIIRTKLEHLTLINLPTLKSISPKPLFCTDTELFLTEIIIRRCPHLKKLPLCIDSLQGLRRIEVLECDTMEELLVGDDDETGARIVLSWLRSLKLANLPALERICCKPFVCNSLQKIKITQCPRLKMISLCIDSLRYPGILNAKIVGKKEWWDALDWHDPTNTRLLLQPFFKDDQEEEEKKTKLGEEEEEEGEEEEEEEEEKNKT